MEIQWAVFITLVLEAIGAPTSHKRGIVYENKDVEHTLAESRSARNIDAIHDAPEECENIECPEVSEPVCGTDGITHNNKCKLKLKSCYKPEDNLTIAYEGECQRENEHYIRKSKVITNGNEIISNVGINNGCKSDTTGEYLPHGFNGYHKCVQFECLTNNTWQETGGRLPGCAVGEVKCWDWNEDTAVDIGSEMVHNDMNYKCTEDDWQQVNNQVSSSTETDGCVSEITKEMDPYGTLGYYQCEQYKCLQNGTWHKTGEKLPGCSLEEMKCLNWYTNEIVPKDSVMVHNCTEYICSDFDWKNTQKAALSCPEIVGCVSEITEEMDPYGTLGYYQCEQYKCLRNGTWYKTGEKLPGCSLEEMKCLHWYTNEIVPKDGVMVHNCTEYICSEFDWKKSQNANLSCPENKNCINPLSKVEVPQSYKGYYNCMQYECTEEMNWKETGEKLAGCFDGKSRCWDWHQDEGVPLNSILIQDNIQFTCTENDWQITILDPSSNSPQAPSLGSETDGCLSEITKELVPYEYKGYYKCEQFECMSDKTWQTTGKKLSACSTGEVKCWDWKLGMAVPIASTLLYNNLQYECTAEDWARLPQPAFEETDGCFSEITKEIDPYGTLGYFRCEQYYCLQNGTWHATGEKLPGCSLEEMKCLHWYTNEIVPKDSVMVHNCTEYICSEFDWKNTQNVALSCPEKKNCSNIYTQLEVPNGYKGYFNCKQYECTEEMEWKETGEELLGCFDGKSRCWDWQQDEGVPLDSILIQDNVLYMCTEADWQKTILDPSSNSPQASTLSTVTDGCMSKITNELVPYEHKGYYKCEQFECMSDNTWHKTGKNLSACSLGEVKCWNWKLGMAVPIASTLLYNHHQYECTAEDWIPLQKPTHDEPAMIKEERFDSPCNPGVTSEHNGQQCCCNDEAILECDGPCPEIIPENIMSDVEPLVSNSTTCRPGEPIESQEENCCCTNDGIIDCSGNSCQEPESTTMMGMETTTEESSSSKEDLSLLLFLLSTAFLCIQ